VTGPTGSGSSPATSTSLGTIQLTGDLTGVATSPIIKTYTSNMLKDINNFILLGQSSQGGTSSVPIAFGTISIGAFQFVPNTLQTTGSISIALKTSNVTNFTAYGSGFFTRGSAGVQTAILQAASIQNFYKNIVTLAVTPVDGCLVNESEEWKIYLYNASNDVYFLHLFYFRNPNLTTQIFGTLYGIKQV